MLSGYKSQLLIIVQQYEMEKEFGYYFNVGNQSDPYKHFPHISIIHTIRTKDHEGLISHVVFKKPDNNN